MTFTDETPRNRCGHRLWGDVDAVQCSRPTGHRAGHTYHSTDGSAVPDHHTTTEPNEES